MAIDIVSESEAASAPDSGEMVVPGICGVCSAGCGVEIVLENGRIKRLRPRHGHPRGIVCTRGTRAPEIVYSPDRLLYPQLRVGERGHGRFERVQPPPLPEFEPPEFEPPEREPSLPESP